MANEPVSATPAPRAASFSILATAIVGLLILSVGQDLLLASQPQAAARRLTLLDMTRDGALSSWLVAGLLAAVAVSLFEVGRRERKADDEFAWHWLLLAVAFAGMAVDELTGLHEAALRLAAPALRFDWPPSLAAYLLAAALALLAATYARFLNAMPAVIRMLMMLAAVLTALDTAAASAVADALLRAGEQDGLAYRTVATVEGVIELCAAAVMLYAVSLCRRLQRLDPLRG